MTKKRFFQTIMAVVLIATAGACSKDDDGPDDNLIWDIAPAGIVIQLVDEEGDNLLDPTVEGNWVGEPMWIGDRDDEYYAKWKREDLQLRTRYYMPHFFGTVWTGIWDDKQYSLYFGELDGSDSHDLKLKFGITAINTVYEFEFSHRLVWKNKEPHFDEHITYRGQRIDGSVLKLIVPKNSSSDKAN